MLKNVHINNLALIREADIDYEAGLNIMTGETGSGKSIIISSVNMALGEKANKSLIRSDSEYGLVELTFVTDDSSVFDLMKELDIPEDGNIITVKRRITQDAGITKVNGESVTLSNLKRLTSRLVDIHGQHDHQSLLNPSNHIDILDRFGGAELKAAFDVFRKCYDEYRSLRSQFRKFNMDEDSLDREISLLEHEHKEIEEAALIPGEDLELEDEYRQLGSWEKTSDSLKAAFLAISSDDSGASGSISKALAEIRSAAASDPGNKDLAAFNSTVTDLDSVTKDLSRDLEKYIDERQFDEERYRFVQDRLNRINHLKSKYGRTVDDILKYDSNTCDKLDKYIAYRKNRSEIEKDLAHLRSELNIAAGRLSEVRKETAARLEKDIISNLSELNFLNSDFRIDIVKAERINEKGFDNVEFMISLNPGESLKPLARVASGGEISRIMLAIKCSIARNDDIPTLIFDEIDTGISGRTAQMVAHKLKVLSKDHQIICITHLPQIAAMADTHFGIKKAAIDGVTISGIEKLDDEQEITEIAGMLSGEEITEASIQNAKELKKLASE